MGYAFQSMDEALQAVAPGTELRKALDMIRAAENGALICIGDVDAVLETASGGFIIDTAFTANRLFELAKMDGAIILDAHARRIIRANVHLTPTVSYETKETGMRHRTAMRMCVQTDTLAITVSQRRGAIDLYFGGESVTLGQIESTRRRNDATILAMQSARDMLDREIMRLMEIEGEEDAGDRG
ncbi:MAG: diadenylate cyclase [Coriobacteriales bacterium]